MYTAIETTITTAGRLAAVANALESVCYRVMRAGELSDAYRAVISCHLAEIASLAKQLGVTAEEINQ